MEYDPNAPETEEDGIQAESLRRLKVRRMLKARPGQTKGLSPSQNDMPERMESPSDDRDDMRE